MRFKCFIVYTSLYFLFLSCSNVSKNKEVVTEESFGVSIETLSDVEDTESATETFKNDFDQTPSKPTLDFYTADIDGYKVLVRKASLMYGEGASASPYTNIIAASPLLFVDTRLADSSIFESKGAKYLRVDDSEYKLSEIKDVIFDPYSKLDYTITTVKKISELEVNEYWNDVVSNYDYSQSFVPVRKTKLYDKVFDADAFLDVTLGKERADISKWTHELRYDTIFTDEVQFVNWSVSTILPFRFDSTVFVLIKTEDIYMGGAHGMYYTTMYNFEVKTGKLLELSDIVDVNSDSFNKLLKEAVLRGYDYEMGDDTSSSFTIYPDGIELTFPPYSLGGGMWEKTVFLSYHDLQDVLVRELYPIEKMK